MIKLKNIKKSFYILFFKCTLDCDKCGYGTRKFKNGLLYEYCTKNKIFGDKIK